MLIEYIGPISLEIFFPIERVSLMSCSSPCDYILWFCSFSLHLTRWISCFKFIVIFWSFEICVTIFLIPSFTLNCLRFLFNVNTWSVIAKPAIRSSKGISRIIGLMVVADASIPCWWCDSILVFSSIPINQGGGTLCIWIGGSSLTNCFLLCFSPTMEVRSIGVCKEILCLTIWICNWIFPSSMRPSAWNKFPEWLCLHGLSWTLNF